METKLVQILSRLILVECVIKGEEMVVDVFCDAVNFDFGKVDFDLWVGTRNSVILSIANLLLENRPLSNTDAKS